MSDRRSIRAIPLLVALLATLFGAPPAGAQPAAAVPEDCRARPSEPSVVLEKRKTDIEAKLADVRKAQADTSLDDDRTRALARRLRQLQEDLLEVVFATDCLKFPLPPALDKARAQPEAARKTMSRGYQAPNLPRAEQAPAQQRPAAVGNSGPQPGQTVEVTTYFATNRKLNTAAGTPADTFGNGEVSDLRFGRAVVSIPADHTPGAIELPQFWKFERTPDPNRHFILRSVNPLETDAAKGELAERLRAASSKSLLLYVHGYNMGFQEAALRSAQLAYDLKFPGVPFFYSWPSANRVRGYLQDEETARLCESVFETVLAEISKLPVDEVYVVAHSMGNRIVGHGLQAYIEKGKDTKHIKELLLAAPDINADLFKSTIAPRLAQMQGTRTTIYASSYDLALIASKVVHGFRRVGESSGGVLVFNGMDTVDASNASQSTRNFGHSYLVDSTSVISDLRSVIASHLAAKARGLIQKGAMPDLYWQLP